MDLSIVIVNYNHRHLLAECLQTIVASEPSMTYEIIVVDNASDYDVEKQVKDIRKKLHARNIRLIKNKENIGFGRANNKGVGAAKGRYVLFLNTDIEVTDEAITKIYDFARRKKKSTIVGAKLLNKDGTDQPSAGPFFTIYNTFLMLFLKGDRLGITRYSPNKTTDVDWVSGACFIIKKDDFMRICGFDENIFMYMEEIDLMYRAKKEGVTTIFYPYARFVHIGAATSASRTRPVLNIYRGLLYFYKKHHPRALPVLQFLLRTKAGLSYILGKATGNTYLVSTYEHASEIVKRERLV